MTVVNVEWPSIWWKWKLDSCAFEGGRTTDFWTSISRLFAYMAIRAASCLCLLIYLHLFVSGIAFDEKPVGDIHKLRVGEEIMDHCHYLLHGLKSPLSYEVKISYPASIPASFSFRLKQGDDHLGMSLTRRLLNTEKLIFEAEANYLDNTYILVTVEPAGIVASPTVSEREFVLFNIVCDKLLAGIPYKAWWVGILALLCIGFSVIIPFYFPPSFRPSFESCKLAFSEAY